MNYEAQTWSVLMVGWDQITRDTLLSNLLGESTFFLRVKYEKFPVDFGSDVHKPSKGLSAKWGVLRSTPHICPLTVARERLCTR